MQAHLRDFGMNVFKICIGGFIQGRRIRSVAAVALYVGCRSKPEANQYMLIDFADILQVSSISSVLTGVTLTLRVA
jgi:transcription initiation factor TFIIIB Brf1 subunit/transcription initiation factor TFIIB